MLSIGVIGRSRKENERRVPIHPDQLDWLADEVRAGLRFEKGYGQAFDVSDAAIAERSGGVADRETLFAEADVILLAKPMLEDLEAMHEGGILWGWPHCVQQQALTQAAIDRRLTLIAWEAMHKWNSDGRFDMHIFNRNNELAGYASVMQAMSLRGIDGNYGPRRRALVLGFGSVGRGAALALRRLGVTDVTVFTQRNSPLVVDQIPGPEYRHFERSDRGLVAVESNGDRRPFLDAMADADIIVNAVLQDTDHPLMYLNEGEVDALKDGSLIVDVSCDEGMGFPFARPTSFSDPIFRVGRAWYYAVDHSPSLFWDSASWEISTALTPILPIVMSGPERWAESLTITRAIEIRDGVIQNPAILSFQNRAQDYPHEVLDYPAR
jgi:alanine dehydrogenase